ncbi:hypothetical protein Y919_01495 [Caloranaerobacter azorensis H53214]|uniref:NADP oxidoreductase n=1 Tax=Caloranaerobacter azorensis H53214 TaxID=1156417 RepID=A0A096DPZ1_9FIRM|nr:Rossmann-like and DUF2520 domain-containing protein [Caloranaerobacter azorensis]KGG81321.1 hypothetical protein Y919_01495 [Caloranaerobacter azorensis H53214]
MKVGFIGAGKVGCTFGKYLKKNGFDVVGYYSRSFKSAQKGAKEIEGIAFESLQELLDLTQLIFITTPDDAIKKVADEISEYYDIKKGQIFVHMSGALSSKELVSLKQKGAYIYSLHPLQSFADIKSALESLCFTVFTIEGDKEKIDIIKNILKKCGNRFFTITEELKGLYHASACVVSNYLVTLIDYGLKFYEIMGVDKDLAIEAVYPLIKGTIENIKELGTKRALTGPIKRGDVGTIVKHIDSLQNFAPELLNLYKILGYETVKLTEGDYKNKSILELKKILKEHSCNKKI